MTIKQKLVAKKLSENLGKPLGKIMLEAGYSISTAKTPKNLTKSKAWPDLMEKNFPDNFLARQHKKLLNKKEFIAVGEKGDRHIEPTGEIDPSAIARGLDMAYKLKSKYPAEKHDVGGVIAVVNVTRYAEDAKQPIEAEIVP